MSAPAAADGYLGVASKGPKSRASNAKRRKPDSRVVTSPSAEPESAGSSSAVPDTPISDEAAAQAAREEQACLQAMLIRNSGAGVVVGWTAQGLLPGFVGPAGGQAYRNDLLARAGAPGDPIEEMMLDQLALANIQSQRLHAKMAQTDNPEVLKILTGATTRMTSEFRRLAMALKAYRAPAATKQVTVVKQHNVAHGDQQVAVVVQSSGDNKCFSDDTKLASKHEPIAKQAPNEAPQPKASCRRPS